MPKNTESLNRSLFSLLHSKGFDPTLLDTSGKEIPTPEEAEVFQFNFIKDGEDYGKVTISIDGMHKLCVYFSDEVANSEKEESNANDESWYKVLNQLKRFAQKYQLSFELKNVDHLKHDMAKREYMKKQERISEGYYPMGKKASYNDSVPNVKIVLQHTRQIEEGEQRYRNIAKIFLENCEGERFLAPTTKPGIARVYGRLIAEGDKPHGERWNHVTSLVEEYQKMGAFVRATRNGQFNESAQRLVNEGVNHYQGLRETLSRMTGHRGYNTYFESWTPSLMEDESEESNLNELFVQETLDPRIESVMPILSKLQKKVAEMKEVGALAEWADSLTEAPGPETLKHNDETEEGNLKAFDLAEALDPEKKERLYDLIGRYEDATDPEYMGDEDYEDIVAQIRMEFGDKTADSVENGPSTHYPRPGHSMGHDDLAFKQMSKARTPNRITKAGKLHKQDTDAMKRDLKDKLGVEEGILDTVKSVGGKVLDKLGHGNDDDLLKKLQKDAGITAQHGKPSMAKKKDDSDILDEIDMDTLNQLASHSMSHPLVAAGGAAIGATVGKGITKAVDYLQKKKEEKALAKRNQQVAEDEFAGDFKTGPAGQWRNKGPKANKPATVGDLVGASESFDPMKHIDKDKRTPDIKKAAKDVKQGSYADRAALMKAGGVKDDRGPRGVTMAEGEGNLALALDSLKGGWSGWNKEDDLSSDEVDVYEYDDGEGNYYGSGTIEHNLKTGEIKVEFHDSESEVDVDDTFNSVGDAMKALRGPWGQNHGGKAPNFDRLGQRKQHGPDDLRKTDRTGRKGTLAGGPTNQLKQNIQWSKGKHGPKGVLPEGQEDLEAILRIIKR